MVSGVFTHSSPIGNGPILLKVQKGNKLVSVWTILTGTVLTVIVSIAVGRGVVQRRIRRQNRSMRDHLSRISRPYEEHDH